MSIVVHRMQFDGLRYPSQTCLSGYDEILVWQTQHLLSLRANCRALCANLGSACGLVYLYVYTRAILSLFALERRESIACDSLSGCQQK
jgi:hypothetical protein